MVTSGFECLAFERQSARRYCTRLSWRELEKELKAAGKEAEEIERVTGADTKANHPVIDFLRPDWA